MKEPGTDWRERIAPDEEAYFARVAQVIAEFQRVKSAKYGTGRALHRKPLLALDATLEVLPDLPAHARYGLFAAPGRHRARLRLSNGGPDIQPNSRPDIRGFALKVFDVAGEGALGGTTDHQDFLMINQDRLTSPDSREFVAFVEAATHGMARGILHLFTAYGLGGGWARLRTLFAILSKKFDSFANERFNTVSPHACGPYAARARLKPTGNPARREPSTDIVQDMRDRLAAGPVAWDLELQFFVDEATTPIEDASKPWPDNATPIVTVARLTVPQQSGDGLLAETEAARFDPWSGLLAHRPLGEVMRARKVAYFASQKGRGASA